MMAQEKQFLKSQEQFGALCELVQQAGRDGLRMDEIERQLMPGLMLLGRRFLEGHVAALGDGDVGTNVSSDDRTLQRSQEPHSRRYLSIFGELIIRRYVYVAREGQKAEYVPLDARLGLPAGENSYLLEEWQQRLCVKDAFGESVDDLKAILGTGVSVRTAEEMNHRMAEYVPDYRVSQPVPTADEEQELLIVTGDGKGVVMRRPFEDELREQLELTSGNAPTSVPDATSSLEPAPPEVCGERRRPRSPRRARQARRRQAAEALRKHAHHPSRPVATERNERKSKKQMAYVGAVYTIARFRRTTDDVLDEMARRARAENRPRPQHKRVWAEMTRILQGEPCSGREWLFCSLALECNQRDPTRQKTLICLLDGEHSLWDMQRYWFQRAVGILDIFHVSERVWGVAHCFQKQGTGAAQIFATHHLRMILDGKVRYVTRNFRRLLTEHKLSTEKRKTVQAAITYFENNCEHMHYDQYLAAGYPIGSGVAEGACRHLVKDRMELTGMRWERPGAQAMLHLRAIYLNNEWNDFVNFRIQNEQAKLYGPGTIYTELGSYAQAA